MSRGWGGEAPASGHNLPSLVGVALGAEGGVREAGAARLGGVQPGAAAGTRGKRPREVPCERGGRGTLGRILGVLFGGTASQGKSKECQGGQQLLAGQEAML